MNTHKVKFPFILQEYSGPMDGEFVDGVKTWKPGTRCERCIWGRPTGPSSRSRPSNTNTN